MAKLMERKLPWTGPSLQVKVAEVGAEEEKADLVAEAREALEGAETSEVPEGRVQAIKTEGKV